MKCCVPNHLKHHTHTFLTFVANHHTHTLLTFDLTLVQVLSARGATFIAADNWSSHVQSDGLIFTGQNPASATAVGKAIVDALALS